MYVSWSVVENYSNYWVDVRSEIINIGSEPEPKTESEPESELKPETEPEPETKPEPGTEPGPGTVPEPKVEPEPSGKPEHHGKPEQLQKSSVGKQTKPWHPIYEGCFIEKVGTL